VLPTNFKQAMNQRSKRFSQTSLSYVEEMKSKLQKLDFIRNTTNAMIAQSDMVPTTNIKAKKRTVQPLPRLSIQKNLSILNITSHNPTTQVNRKTSLENKLSRI